MLVFGDNDRFTTPHIAEFYNLLGGNPSGCRMRVWSLAPWLALAAAWLTPRLSNRLSLAGLGLAIEASVVISFGAAPLYLALVLPLVLLTFIALWVGRRAPAAAS